MKTTHTTVKETVTACIYAVTVDGTAHEVLAGSPAELAKQLQQLSGNARSAQLARLVWDDRDASIASGGISIVSIGRVVRQTWGALPVARSPRRKSPEAPHPAAPASEDTWQPSEGSHFDTLFRDVPDKPEP